MSRPGSILDSVEARDVPIRTISTDFRARSSVTAD